MKRAHVDVLKKHIAAVADGQPMPSINDPACRELLDAMRAAFGLDEAPAAADARYAGFASIGVFACGLLSERLGATIVAERSLTIFRDNSGRPC